jgi:phosphate uptake regulator
MPRGVSVELRHVQESGGTYFISLPKNWVQRVGVSKGAVLAVVEAQDGCLTLDARFDHRKFSQPVTVVPSPHLQRELTGKYLLGADTILIQGGNRLTPEVSETVRQTARRLIGLEIVEEDSHKILLQCLLDPSGFPAQRVLRRQYLLAAGMHRDALSALDEGDTGLAKSIVERDDEVDRLYFLLVRLLRTQVLNPHLSEKMGMPLIDCLDYRLVASYIESIGDCAVRMARSVIEFEGAHPPPELLDVLRQVGQQSYGMHDMAMKAIFSKDLGLVGDVLESNAQVKALLKTLENSLSGKPPDVITFCSYIVSALANIVDFAVDLADIVMPR